jgi:hypothetical protein
VEGGKPAKTDDKKGESKKAETKPAEQKKWFWLY